LTKAIEIATSLWIVIEFWVRKTFSSDDIKQQLAFRILWDTIDSCER